MVHRSSEEDNTFIEETPLPRRFSSSLSRNNSKAESINGHQQEGYIFYRPPDKDYFEGPFSEVQCQFWYKEGSFFNGLEFKFGFDGRIETLESLKARNGRECPFQEGVAKSILPHSNDLKLMERIVYLSGELDKVKEDRNSRQFARKIEMDSLKNRITELMEKDKSNEQYRREKEVEMNEMKAEIAELRESLANSAMNIENVEYGAEVATDELDTAFCARGSVSLSEKTAVDVFIREDSCTDVNEVRSELDRLQKSIQSLDNFTFKLSNKVAKLKCKLKVVDAIGAGLDNKDGVFDRLGYLERSVEEMQVVVDCMKREGDGKEEEEEVVLPVQRERQSEGSSIPEQWYSPNEKFVLSESDLTLTSTSFTAASESIAAVATAAWPGPEKIVEVGEHGDVDNWENIDEDATDDQWNVDMVNREVETPPPLEEDPVEEPIGDVDKENIRATMEGGEDRDRLNLIGNGLGLFLRSADSDCDDMASDSDIERLLTAIKGSKMLLIAESLKQHFAKAMMCDVCSTEEKKAELRNAIEYFEHLNRSHFRKCGVVDKMLVNQLACLLETFKAPVLVPMSIAKRQYAEREKKPWLKREGTTSPTRKTTGKKRK